MSFDSPAKTDVVIRFLTCAKVFVSTSTGSRIRDLPHGASVVEWLERALALREVLASIPGRGGHKKFYGSRKLLNISFRMADKRQQFNTLKHTMQSQEQHNNSSLQRLYALELDLSPFPPDVAHFLLNNL